MIPKILHTVWPGEDPFFNKEVRYLDYLLSWVRFHPDWTHCFWRVANLPLDKFMPNIRQAVLSPKIHYVIKSDAIRWELERIFGGVCKDPDTECFAPIDSFLNTSTLCGTVRGEHCNAFIGAVPNAAPVIAACEYLNGIDFEAIKTAQDVVNVCGCQGVKKFLQQFETIIPNVFYDVHINGDPSRDSERYSTHHWSHNRRDGWSKDFK